MVVLVVEEAEPVPVSVLDLLSDDAAGFDSALPPSFDDTFEVDSFDFDSFAVDSFGVDSFAVDSFDSDPESEDVPFFRASDG
ncbi:MAG TPA: hypothetical protein VGA90_12890 [Methylomirabilota bacterium]